MTQVSALKSRTNFLQILQRILYLINFSYTNQLQQQITAKPGQPQNSHASPRPDPARASALHMIAPCQQLTLQNDMAKGYLALRFRLLLTLL